jgi:hypothetical protein
MSSQKGENTFLIPSQGIVFLENCQFSSVVKDTILAFQAQKHCSCERKCSATGIVKLL